MKDDVVGAIVTILAAVVGVAIISVLVGSGSQTAQVLTAGGTAFSNILKAATGPATGNGLTGGGTLTMPTIP